MKLLKNNFVSFIILVLVVMLSTAVSSISAINREANQISKFFMVGVDDTDFPIQEALDRLIEHSYNYIKIAEKHSVEAKYVDRLDTARAGLMKAKTASEKYSAMLELEYAYKDTYIQMENIEGDKYIKNIYEDMLEASKLARYSKYNEKVEDYINKYDNAFPSGIFMNFGFVKKVDYFR